MLCVASNIVTQVKTYGQLFIARRRVHVVVVVLIITVVLLGFSESSCGLAMVMKNVRGSVDIGVVVGVVGGHESKREVSQYNTPLCFLTPMPAEDTSSSTSAPNIWVAASDGDLARVTVSNCPKYTDDQILMDLFAEPHRAARCASTLKTNTPVLTFPSCQECLRMLLTITLIAQCTQGPAMSGLSSHAFDDNAQ